MPNLSYHFHRETRYLVSLFFFQIRSLNLKKDVNTVCMNITFNILFTSDICKSVPCFPDYANASSYVNVNTYHQNGYTW